MKKTLHIGDKVRMLHSQGQGVVTGRDGRGLVLVELEDGFEVPVRDQDLALVLVDEAPAKPKAVPTKPPAGLAGKTPPHPPKEQSDKPAGAVARQGMFLALSAPLAGTDDRQLIVINNTDVHWVGMVGYDQAGAYRTQAGFSVSGRQAQLLATLTGALLKAGPIIQFWGLGAELGDRSLPRGTYTRWTLAGSPATWAAEPAPITGRPSLVFQVDGPTAQEIDLTGQRAGQPANQSATTKGENASPSKESPLDPAQLINRWMGDDRPGAVTVNRPTNPQHEVDLHIELLTPHAGSLATPEILTLQLDTFERELDSALRTGADEIIFIHGVGQGTLRTEIHRRLSGHPGVEYFKDWHRERQGHGATLVKLR